MISSLRLLPRFNLNSVKQLRSDWRSVIKVKKIRTLIRIIVVRLNGKNFPIELKYKTVKGSYADFGNEVVELMTHSAVDLGCYAYLKDINRLEYLAKNDSDFERGFAIILTNEPLYFKDTGRRSVYEAFKIYDGML